MTESIKALKRNIMRSVTSRVDYMYNTWRVSVWDEDIFKNDIYSTITKRYADTIPWLELFDSDFDLKMIVEQAWQTRLEATRLFLERYKI